MLLVETPAGYAVIAVEGKVREPFGDRVEDWLVDSRASDGSRKQERLAGLCSQLRLDQAKVGRLRYQLLHRSVSAILEARRYGVSQALLLVHAFDPAPHSLADLQAFAIAIGSELGDVESVSAPVELDGVEFSLCWIGDTPLEA
jgi:hypothetical protein